jgi:hypothetical protein
MAKTGIQESINRKPYDIGLNISGWHQLHFMAHRHKSSRPIVTRRTCLNSDQASRQSFEKFTNLAAPKLPADNHVTDCVDPVNLKTLLAISIPTVVTSFIEGSPFCGFQQPHRGITDATVGNRPLNQALINAKHS